MTVTGVHLAGDPDRPLLLLGPSLGTTVETLWSEAAALLGHRFHVVGWDLPGHGTNRDAPPRDLTMAGLARDVLALVDTLEPGAAFHHAGNSVGGAVGLQLALDAPERVLTTTVLCTGAKILDAEAWQERAALVAASGTPAVATSSAERWFAPGFMERRPQTASALLHALADADESGYVAVCNALADYDVRDRLAAIATPVLAVAGAEDHVTPRESLALIAASVPAGRLVVLGGAGHLAAAERPERVAQLVIGHALEGHPREGPGSDVREAGMRVRREVLGDAHVDRAVAGTTEFTRDFQELITEYAWGTIWTRPGLDRRSRSLITLTALVARGHHEELAMHVRAARRNGLTVEEIKELLLQTAVYCGVPDANTAFRIAQTVLDDEEP